ncbi:Sugar tr and/or MFS 1 domain containing protein [Asbolus verrucosus]|uniref:Sugar tr and/or MFS 1 domain containing protein n=1 Tax=Asbolus verrucosus TaxID=1661398 RepID=A0A482W569_ASBVE|nr:Sugar tr and/or MFS 1 domain containing protein [Asbolus verrucosus]
MQKLDLDEILVALGGWGKFHTLYYLVLCSAIIFSVFPAMNYIFIARDVKYRFGRKSMILVSVFLSTIVGLIRSFSINYYMYIGLEFLNTLVGSGVYSGAFILALELVDSKRRNLGNSIICFAFTIGHLLLGAAAWVSPSWQFMLQITYAPGLLVTLLLWFIPESVRWLISKDKISEAEEILKSIAKINGAELTEDALQNIPYIEQTDKAEENEKIPLMAVLRKKSLLIRIIHCSFTWICCNFPYYGLTIQSVALSDDIYINYMCVSVVEIPAYVLAYASLDRIGRKKTLALSLIFAGIACISVDFIQAGNI